MPIFGDRLRDVREAMGLSQQDLADLCGVTMRSQRNYEKGERNPDSVYLAALAAAGADVLYLLTGQRAGGPPPTASTLTPRQQALLDNYERADEQSKQIIEAAAQAVNPGARRTG